MTSNVPWLKSAREYFFACTLLGWELNVKGPALGPAAAPAAGRLPATEPPMFEADAPASEGGADLRAAGAAAALGAAAAAAAAVGAVRAEVCRVVGASAAGLGFTPAAAGAAAGRGAAF